MAAKLNDKINVRTICNPLRKVGATRSRIVRHPRLDISLRLF
jgi:hypothetical protein